MIPGWLNRLISVDHPESPQLVVVLSASAALILSLVAVVACCAYVIVVAHDLGSGALLALTASIGGLTALAIHSNKQVQP